MPFFKVSLTFFLEASTENEAGYAAWEAAKSARGMILITGTSESVKEISSESAARLRKITESPQSAAISHPMFPVRPGLTKVRFKPEAAAILDSLQIKNTAI